MTLLRSGLGVESVGNTTLISLGSGATFTGVGEFNGFPDVMVMCKTDNTGTIYFDFSPDGTNWDSTFPPLGFSVANGISEFHVAVKGPRYFRVRLVNDTGAQSYLRLYTYYGEFNQGNLPLNANIGQDADSIVVRPTNYHYEAALGRYNGVEIWNKFGYNNDVDVAASETICSFGGTFAPLAAADTLDFVSTDINDDVGSTGATQLIVYGIDANYEQLLEVVDMDGVTPVTTSGSFLGVNRVAIYTAGTSGENEGTITVTDTGGGAVQAEIPIGEGTTQQAFFFVQSNHTALVDWLVLNCLRITGGGGSQPIVTIKCWVHSLVSGAKYLVLLHKIDTATENTVELKPSQPLIVGEKSLITFEAATDTNNTEISCRFSLIEQQNI